VEIHTSNLLRKENMLTGLILITLAVWERLWFDLGPNVELVTMASVLAGMYLTSKWRWAVPVVIMAVSDVLLGVRWISVFTWSGFLFTTWLAKRYTRKGRNKMVGGVGAGVLGTIWFYVWTNFGVWLTDIWGMYSRDLGGLWRCYINGLPFLRQQMISTGIFVPMGIVIVEIWINRRVIASYIKNRTHFVLDRKYNR
jgi:hypothetical protein